MRKTIPAPPENGDTRIIEKFLFFPKSLRPEGSYSGVLTKIWWEKVKIKQSYSRVSWGHYGWRDEHFVYE